MNIAMSSDPIRRTIRDVLAVHAKLTVDVATLADDDDLFASGMASFASINVMLGLEDALGIEFPDSVLTRDSFKSVNAIAAVVDAVQTLA